MTSVAAVALAWAIFAGSHVGLATGPVRARMVARLGDRGFVFVYTAIASILFAALVATYAAVAADGPAGPDLARTWAREPLIAAIVAGFVLGAGAFAPTHYWQSPLAVLGDHVRGPIGLERVTRHAMFAGIALIAGAHALLASRLTGTVFFAGFIVLAVLGPVHQAAKLRAARGAAFDDYLACSSAVPFAAIVRGRQRLVLRELPWIAFAIGGAVAWLVWAHHDGVLAFHGAAVSGPVIAGSVTIGLIQLARTRR